MGDGAAGGLCRHQIWSLFWPPKTARNDTFLCLTRKITHKLVLCIILSTIFKLKEVEKNMYFHSKQLAADNFRCGCYRPGKN